MIPRARFIMLNLYHILIDGLFDSVPVVLAFMALALGSGETDVGLVVSLGAALSTAVGLGTGLFSRRFGFYGSVTLLIGLAGLGYLGAAFAGSMITAGACFVLAMANTERQSLGRVMSDFTAIGDVGAYPAGVFCRLCGGLLCGNHAGLAGSVPGLWRAGPVRRPVALLHRCKKIPIGRRQHAS